MKGDLATSIEKLEKKGDWEEIALQAGFTPRELRGMKKDKIKEMLEDYGIISVVKGRGGKAPPKQGPMPKPTPSSGGSMTSIMKTPVFKKKAGVFGMTLLVTWSGGFVISKYLLDQYNPEKNNVGGAVVVGGILGGLVSYFTTSWIKGV